MNMKKENIKDMYRLSPMQEGILFHTFLEPETTAYFQQFAFKIEGALDIALFQRSFDLLVERHDVLRTTFVYEKVKRPLQVVFKSWPKTLQVTDLSGLPETAKAARVEQLKAQDLEQRFDLSKDDLLRITVIQTHADQYTILISYHHILMDGWCIGIIAEELFDAYEAFRNGREVRFNEPYPFSRFMSWLDKQDLEEAAQVWRRYLDGYGQTAIVPQQQQPQPGRYELREHRLAVDPARTGQLNALARKYGVTLNVLMQTIWGVVLSKYNQTDDVVFGAVVSGRPAELPGIDRTVGLFINTVPVRIRCEETLSFEELLQRVHRSSVEMKKHEHFPLHEAQQVSELKQQLIQHIMLFQNYPVHEIAESAGADLGFKVSDVNLFEMTNYDFELIVEPGETLNVMIRFNAAVYEPSFIEAVAGHIDQTIRTVVETPGCALQHIELLSEEERQRILFDFNRTEQPLAEHALIQQAFEQRAAAMPDSIAVEGRGRLTFGELNRKANQLAWRLRQEGVGPGTLVGLLANPAEEMVIAMLAILKAGGAYVPIDPQFPPDRIAYMLEDSKAKLLLTQAALTRDLPGHVQVIEIDRAELYAGQSDNLPALQQDSDLAYVIYTSGSTGQPKGVMVSHRNVINFFAGMDERVQPAEDDAVLAVTTISFDISVLELLWPLTRGLSVVLHGTSGRQFDHFDHYLDGRSEAGVDFSFFFFSSYDQGQEKHQNKYQLLLDTAKYADRNGFSAVWTPERHFHPFGGLYPNPSVTSAALAMVTEKLQLRSGSVVAPLHNTLRIAEEWAVVDNLSGGRTGVSFTAGWHPDDFALNPEQYAGRHETMFRQIEEVKRLWRGESVPVPNGVGQEIEVRVYPEPIQPELPVWVTTSGSEETIMGAGRIGANLLTHLLGQDIDGLAANIALYRRTLAEHGFAPDHGKVAVMLHTYIGEDVDTVKQTVKGPFCDYLRSSLGLIRNLADALHIDTADLQTEEAMQTLLEYGFDRYWQTAALLGTPESCKELVGRLMEAGVDEIACLIDFGIGHDLVKEGFDRLNELRQAFAKPDSAQQNDQRQKVTVLQSTPTRIRSLLKDPHSQAFLRSLRTILVGGESFPADLAGSLRSMTKARIVNMYGPTETTVWSATYELPPEARSIRIGTPIANTQIYVLDPHSRPVPVGVAGELFIGGEGVAKGYLNRPELTAERFLPNPVTGAGRMYRTGDVGRLMPDGTIELFGRIDHQVKVRGYRIEAGEIEAVLLRHGSVGEAAVTVQEEPGGEKSLVAFVVWKQPGDEASLRAFASDFLPYYMLPARYTYVQHLPLTPNGKTDYGALRRLGQESLPAVQFVEPSSAAEIVMADVWRQVLGLESIGIHDNFFRLGGDSISALQISSQLLKHGYKMQMNHLFQQPTIAELSRLVQTVDGKKETATAAAGPVTLTPIQLWFWEQKLTDAHHYNHAVVLQSASRLDVALVQRVLKQLAVHHDALRIVFRKHGDAVEALNRAEKEGGIELRVIDLTREELYREQAEAELAKLQASFHLADGPLAVAALVQTAEADHLMFAIHHLLVDGVSWRVLLEDFAEGYRQAQRGEDIRFQPKTESFQAYAQRLAAYAESEALHAELAYWKELEQTVYKPLPYKQPSVRRPAVRTSRVTLVTLTPQETQMLLKEIHHAYNTEINDILLTALGYAVQEWTGSSSVLFDLEGHGREPFAGHVDVSRTVGWFTSIYPVALDMSPSGTMADRIKRVKESLRRIPGKGLGYGVLKYMTSAERKRELAFTLQPEIMFNYLGQFDQSLADDLFDWSPLSAGPLTAPAAERKYALLVNGSITQKALTVSFDYSSEQFNDSDMEQLAASYRRHLLAIIEHCSGKGQTELTPHDLLYQDLTIEELDELNAEIAASITEWGDEE